MTPEAWQLEALDNIDPYQLVELENRAAVEELNHVNDDQDYE